MEERLSVAYQSALRTSCWEIEFTLHPRVWLYILDSGGDVIVRLNRQTLPLFNSKRERMDGLQLLRGLSGGQLYE